MFSELAPLAVNPCVTSVDSSLFLASVESSGL